MRIYYISDIHLELRKKIPKQIIDSFKRIKRDRDILKNKNLEKEEGEKYVIVLAGDIGNSFDDNYRKLLRKCRKYFDQVFVIHGNHEYYNKSNDSRTKLTMEDFEKQTQKVCDEENCNFLNKCVFLYEDVVFVGCTLWTKVDEDAQKKLNDYRYIYTYCGEESSSPSSSFPSSPPSSRKITHYDIYYEHLTDVTFLEDVLKSYGMCLTSPRSLENKEKENKDSLENREGKMGRVKGIVVVTHHAPSYKMSCRSDALSKYYVNDLDYLFKPPLLAWISGHTHCSTQLNIDGIPCVSNCYGYQTQTQQETNFTYELYVQI